MANLPTLAATSPAITLADDDYTMQEAPEDEELEKAIAMSMVEDQPPVSPSPISPSSIPPALSTPPILSLPPSMASSSSSSLLPPLPGPPKPLSTSAVVLEKLLEVVLEQFKLVRNRGGVAIIPYLQVVHALIKKRINFYFVCFYNHDSFDILY